MARNGAGTYSLPAGNPVVTGSTISSTWANSTLTDIGTAITQSIAYDGQTTPVANLPMGTYAHTNVGNATVRAMYASMGQVQDSVASKLSSVSGTNAITATASFGMSAYVAGQAFIFVATGDNTGASTININSIGAKSITKNGTTALVAGDIVTGGAYEVIYDGTQFQLVNPSPAAVVSSFSAGTTGLTPSTATTGAVTLAGTLAVANGGTGSTSLTANSVMLGNGTSALSGNMVAPSTSGNVLTSNGTTWTSAANNKLTSATSQTTTATTVTFGSIPSWVKRITVSLQSIVGGGNSYIRLGTSGGIVSTGYSGAHSDITSTPNNSSPTAGIFLGNTTGTIRGGIATITNISGNNWVYTYHGSDSATPQIDNGSIALSGTLTQLQLAFNSAPSSGTANIMYD